MEKTEIKKYRVQVGMMLKQARENEGWTAEQVAVMADVKPATIEKIEAGAFNVPFDVLSRVADVLGCEMTIKSKGE